MSKRKGSDNLELLKQYRGLVREIELALEELVDPEKSHKEEIDFHYDVYIDKGGETLVLEVEMPGLNVDDISIYTTDKFLEISGSKKTKRSNKYDHCICLERDNGRFRKVIFLGKTVNFNEAQSQLCDGVLTVKMPIVKEKRGIKQITINPGSYNDK